MGNRYGRNKRRAHRERIAELERDLRRRDDRVNELDAIVGRQHQALLRVAQCLGKHFIGLPPQALDRIGEDEDVVVQMRRHVPLSFEAQTAYAVSESVVRLERVASRIEVDGLRQQLHCTVQYQDGRDGYYVSRQAMYSAPRNVVAHNVGHALAQELVKYFRKNGRGFEGFR